MNAIRLFLIVVSVLALASARARADYPYSANQKCIDMMDGIQRAEGVDPLAEIGSQYSKGTMNIRNDVFFDYDDGRTPVREPWMVPGVQLWFIDDYGQLAAGYVTAITAGEDVQVSGYKVEPLIPTQDSDNDGVLNQDDFNPCDPDVQTQDDVDPCDAKGGDADNDGICDDYDPCTGPNDQMRWKVVAECRDSSGTLESQRLHLDCDGSGQVIQEKTVVYTDGPIECFEVSIQPGDTPLDKTADDWPNGEETDVALAEANPEGYTYRGEWAQKNGVPSSPATGIETGKGSDEVDPADGDSGLLEAIVDNTKASTTNDQVVADYLKAMNEMGSENGDTLKRMMEALEGDGTHGDGTGGNDGDGIPGGSDDGVSASAQGVMDSAVSDAISQLDATYEVPEEYQEKETFADIFDPFFNSSPIGSWLTGAQLQADGSPSFNADLWGRSITFDISRFQSVFQAWGAILEMLVLFSCTMIIFRRR